MNTSRDSGSTAGLRQLWLWLVLLFAVLVGLATAFLYERVLERAEAEVERSALSYQRLIYNEAADLDRFVRVAAAELLVDRTISPEQAGDRILTQCARRIDNALRQPDVAARFGGDEFVVLLHHLSDPDQALAVAERIAKQLRQPFAIEDHEIRISCSIGVALYPIDGDHQSELILNADRAMYQAKKNGRSLVQRYGSECRA